MDAIVAIILAAFAAENERDVGQSSRDVASLNDCGPIALQVCAIVSGRDISTTDVDRVIAVKGDGCSLLDLENATSALGIPSVAVRWTHRHPADGAAPAVIPIVNKKGKKHFVAVAGWQQGKALVVDVPSGPVWVDIAKLRTGLAWDGAALHISAADGAQLDVRQKSKRSAIIYGGLGICLAFVAAYALRGGLKK